MKLVKGKRGTGYFINVRELQLEDTEGVKEMMRMDFDENEILNLIAPDTPLEIIGGNKVISAAECLAVTLRFFS